MNIVKWVNILMLLFLGNSLIRAQSENSVEIPMTISIPEVAMVDFFSESRLFTEQSGKSGNQSVEQIVTPGTKATWLNYSSVVKPGTMNTISACISRANTPSNIVLKLDVGYDVGAGSGAVGLPSDAVELNWFPQIIITNIGSCYTGRGYNKGHRLTYRWIDQDGELDANFDPNRYSIAVTYTISSSR